MNHWFEINPKNIPEGILFCTQRLHHYRNIVAKILASFRYCTVSLAYLATGGLHSVHPIGEIIWHVDGLLFQKVKKGRPTCTCHEWGKSHVAALHTWIYDRKAIWGIYSGCSYLTLSQIWFLNWKNKKQISISDKNTDCLLLASANRHRDKVWIPVFAWKRIPGYISKNKFNTINTEKVLTP